MRNVFHKVAVVFAIVHVIVFAVITAFLCLEFNVKTGVIIGTIIFLSLGGLELTWFLATASSRKRQGKTLEQIEAETFNKATENNPTIR